jgi:hypothetical protein
MLPYVRPLDFLYVHQSIMSELENLPLDINKISDIHIKSRDEALICVVSQIRTGNWSSNEPFIIKLFYELRNNKHFTNIFKFAINSFLLANFLFPRRKWSVFNTWTSWKLSTTLDIKAIPLETIRASHGISYI